MGKENSTPPGFDPCLARSDSLSRPTINIYLAIKYGTAYWTFTEEVLLGHAVFAVSRYVSCIFLIQTHKEQSLSATYREQAICDTTFITVRLRTQDSICAGHFKWFPSGASLQVYPLNPVLNGQQTLASPRRTFSHLRRLSTDLPARDTTCTHTHDMLQHHRNI